MERWTSDHEAGFQHMQNTLSETLDQAFLDYGDDALEVLGQIGQLVGGWEPPAP